MVSQQYVIQVVHADGREGDPSPPVDALGACIAAEFLPWATVTAFPWEVS